MPDIKFNLMPLTLISKDEERHKIIFCHEEEESSHSDSELNSTEVTFKLPYEEVPARGVNAECSSFNITDFFVLIA